MKEASQAVESSVIELITSKKTDALPNWLVSWVTLPVAVYHVNRHVKPNPAPDRVLMPFLNRFMRRTTGAQFLFLALNKALKEFLEQKCEDGGGRKTKARKIAPAAYHTDHAPPPSEVRTTFQEAKVLAYVTKALDHTLELEC